MYISLLICISRTRRELLTYHILISEIQTTYLGTEGSHTPVSATCAPLVYGRVYVKHLPALLTACAVGSNANISLERITDSYGARPRVTASCAPVG